MQGARLSEAGAKMHQVLNIKNHNHIYQTFKYLSIKYIRKTIKLSILKINNSLCRNTIIFSILFNHLLVEKISK